MASARRSAVVSILFTVFGGPGIVLVYLPFAITRFSIPLGQPWWQTLTGAAVIVIGLIPLFDSIWRFVQEGRGTLMPTVPTEHLVVGGLYRYTRNPMYVGVLTSVLGEAELFASFWMLAYSAVVWLIIDQFIRRYEEPTLQRRHGAEYTLYCEQVPRWWRAIPPANVPLPK